MYCILVREITGRNKLFVYYANFFFVVAFGIFFSY